MLLKFTKRKFYFLKKRFTLNQFLCFLFLSIVYSKADAQLNLRYTTNSKGDIMFVANNNISCNSNLSVCTKTATNYTYSGPESATWNNNTNNIQGSTTTVDPIPFFNDIDGDPTTFNSSSATYSYPSTTICPQVLWAGLYWGAEISAQSQIVNIPLAYTTSLTFANRTNIRFKTPASSLYNTLSADATWTSGLTYHCFKDVTNLVSSSGPGIYTVANIVSRTDANAAKDGGWTLVIVYSDKNAVKRNLSVFDGIVSVSSSNPLVNVPISGFATPPSGPIGVRCGLVVYDGDRSSISDSLQFRGAGGSNFPNFVSLSDATHSVNNVFNSTISNYGVIASGRNPSNNNTIGYDASLFTVPNSGNSNLGNNATSATLKFTTGSEAYRVGVAVTMIDVIDPELEIKKGVTDVNGGTAQPGDILEYTIKAINRGNDTSTLTTIFDTIPFNTSYVANSLLINGASRTDAIGDDQAEFNGGSKIVKFNVGVNSNATSGGRIRINDSVTVKFRVKITEDCAVLGCTNVISNRAYANYNGFTSNASLNSASVPDTIQACASGATFTTIDVSGICPTPPDVNMLITCPTNFITLSQAIIKDKDSVDLTANYSSFFADANLSTSISNSTPITAPGTYYAVRNIPGANPPCNDVVQINVTQQPQFTNVSISKTDVTCNGLTNGTATAMATGGTSPYSFAWSNSANTNIISNLAAGTYSVTVTDFNNCTISTTVVITQPNILTTSVSGINMVCPGQSGTISVSSIGGTSPYQYQANNGALQTSNTFNLGQGTYTINVVDANNCSVTSTISLVPTDNTAPIVTCPTNKVVSASLNTCSATIANIALSNSDNCAVTKLIWAASGGLNANSPAYGINDISGQSFGIGITTIQYTAFDSLGNSATCSFTVEVVDNQNPIINCPSNISIGNSPGICGNNSVTLGIPVTNDNCGIVSVSNDAPAIFPIGVTTVTWTVTDNSGNTATCSQQVTIADTSTPNLTCPSNTSVNILSGSSCNTIVNGINASFSDNCGISSLTYSLSGATSGTSTNTGINQSSGLVFEKGTTTVTYTLTDVNGNISSCSFDVIVSDTIVPTFTCPSNLTLPTSSASCDAIVSGLGLLTSADNCGSVQISYSVSGATTLTGTGDVSGNLFNKGSNIVKYIVEDNDGNIDSCEFTVTIIDTTKPQFNCPSVQTIYLTPSCIEILPDYTSLISPFDNCSSPGNINIVQTPAPGTAVSGTGTIQIKIVATDEAGNADSCFFDVNKVNANPPVMNCIGAQNIQLNVNCEASLPDYTSLISSSDVCLGNSGVTVTQTPAPGTLVSGTGTELLKFVATDINNNKDSCFATLIKLDVTAPLINCPANQDLFLNTNCSVSLPNFTNSVTATDACTPTNDIIITQTPAAGTIFNNVSNITVVLAAMDSSGNIATCTFDVAIQDTLKPIVVCPSDTTVSNDLGQCEATMVLNIPISSDNCGIDNISNDAPLTFPVGSTSVTWSIIDIHGNKTTCVQNVIVNDIEPPTINCPADITLTTDIGSCIAASVSLGTPIVNDNCSIASVSNNAPNTFPLGITSVVWTVTDVNGNIATCTQQITVIDAQAPSINCPSDIITTNSPGVCGNNALNLATPTTSDNCGIGSITNNAPAIFPVGSTTVVWTVIDNNGNTATCTQTITINDTEKPTISCPATENLSNTVGLCGNNAVTLATPTTTDNCGIATVSNNAPAIFPIGTTNVTWYVTDLYGNTDSCIQQVIITDTSKPTIICPSDTFVLATNGCEAAINLPTPIATDNCQVQSVNSNITSNIFSAGTTIVTWTVNDINGNSSSCQQLVTVVCPDSIILAPSCTTCPTPLTCPTADQIPNTGTTSYSTCGLSSTDSLQGTLTFDSNGCAIWTPAGNQIDTIYTCIIACNNGICDTTYLKIAPFQFPLDFNLNTFIVSSQNCQNHLTWTTEKETNSSHIEVERSKDDLSYQIISTLNGQGNSISSHTYNMTDYNVKKAESFYYRLKMVDIDGKFKYSPIRFITTNCDKGINDIYAYPNPTNSNINIHLEGEPESYFDIKLYDYTGRMIQSKHHTMTSTKEEITLETSYLSNGIYIIEVHNGIETKAIKFNKIR